ncbi:NAD(P)-dependent alcohol dehydrogenase [Microbacterium sp. LRZ72]|uniref:NAD(P)-dependent alcohol dehydrogenase n=1 Tax=Microbacterium sp. LRZ72 TaxID=2942481 RepID=UPI0029A27FB8|nr:NAD(P)-dependent alcohol dehydrogenase [Microbacterium sp. LRZ72]MDX2376932.1 NAD(P)-dependent alcohol dehydrogenase [Microbacterium sp. LRZ72]
MKTVAAVAREAGAELSLEELELDDLRATEVRVRMLATGVCHTDAVVRDQIYPTPLPAVLGHEGAGVVEAVGSGVTTVAAGDHVVLSVNTCGTCRYCLTGEGTYCVELYAKNFGGSRTDQTTSLTDGEGHRVSSHFFGQSSFAQYANVDERAVVPVDEDVPLALMGPLGCGIQTGAGAVMNTLRPQAGTSIAVFGAGAVGLSAVLAAVAVGCGTIIAVDVNTERLDLARSLGATHTVDAGTLDVAETIMSLTGGAGVDQALETSGLSPVLRQAVDSLAVRGTVGVVGAQPPGTETAFETGLSMTRGWSLRMIIEGDSVPQVFIPRLIELWRQGRFPFDRLVREYPFDQINEAFAASERGDVIKPVVRFPDAP